VLIGLAYFSNSKLLEFDLDNFDDSILSNYVVMADEDVATTAEAPSTNPYMFSNGYIELNEGIVVGKDVCDSYVLIPGIFMLNKTFLAFVYLIGLGYLFMGIAIISDIFMEAIE